MRPLGQLWTSRTQRECKYSCLICNSIRFILKPICFMHTGRTFLVLSSLVDIIVWKHGNPEYTTSSRVHYPNGKSTGASFFIFILSYWILILCWVTFSLKYEQIYKASIFSLCRQETSETSLIGESLETLLSQKRNFPLLSRNTKLISWLITVLFIIKLCSLVLKVDKEYFGTFSNRSSVRKIWTSGSPVKSTNPLTPQQS